MKCPHCGLEHPDNFKFCPEGGLKIEPQTKICSNPKCNFRKPLPLEAKFCPICQSPLSNTMNPKLKTSGIKYIEKPEDLRLPVVIKGKFGYINPVGKICIHPKYDEAYLFNNNCAIVKYQGKWEAINRDGVVLSSSDSFRKESVFDEETYKFITIPSNFKLYSEKFSEGCVPVKNIFNNKYNFINAEGKIMFSENFEEVRSFSDGLAAVRCRDQWGFINKKGEKVIYPIFDSVDSFVEGKVIVKFQQKYGVIDKNGNWILYPNFDLLMDLKDGIMQASDSDTRYIIDIKFFNALVKFNYNNWRSYQNLGNRILALYKKESNCGHLYNFDNKKINSGGPCNNIGGYTFGPAHMHLDNYDNIGFGPAFETTGKEFVAGYIPYLQNGQIGVLDVKGQIIVPPIFKSLSKFFVNKLKFG